MTCTDAQVRLAMKERSKGHTQEQAAVKANVKSRKTVAKYEQLGQLPGQLKQPRTYRTRKDPFAKDWSQLEQMLQAAPELEATTLFEWLGEQHPQRYQENQLRTLQRRVADWRALHQERLAVLEQVHRPGEVLQSDGVWLTDLGVTIAGEPFKHLLLHCVLPYSNWEWGAIAQSESLLAFQRALEATLFKLGAVPDSHQTDNSSAVTHHLSPADHNRERAFNQAYLVLLNHYGLKPRTIQLGCPEQNGDIEVGNGGLKRALEQHLLLRGGRDFATVAEYEQFLEQVMTKRNQGRQQRLSEELAVMRPLMVKPLGPYQEVRLRVNRASLIRVQHNAYSVPTSLINQQVRVQIYEWHLEVYYRQQLVETMPRLIGQNQCHLNYRHVIDSLLRKPGGFRNYRYREALFPSLVFRQAWDTLNQWYAPRKADLIYLRLLHLAARHSESEVTVALVQLLAGQAHWDDTTVAGLIAPTPLPIPQLAVPPINLSQYDALLGEVSYAAA